MNVTKVFPLIAKLAFIYFSLIFFRRSTIEKMMEFNHHHWPTIPFTILDSIEISNSNRRSFENELASILLMPMLKNRHYIYVQISALVVSKWTKVTFLQYLIFYLPSTLRLHDFTRSRSRFRDKAKRLPPRLICPVPINRYKCATCTQIRVESRGDQQYPYFSISPRKIHVHERYTIIWITLSPFPSFSME